MKDPIYMFSWDPMHPTTNSKSQTVMTLDRNMMTRFLLQHGFDPDHANIEVSYDDDLMDECELHEYTFGSRKRDRLYKLVTTAEIVAMVVKEVCDDLSQTLTFGACVMRGEIEIFDTITKLIESLDFGVILDHRNADTSGYDVADDREYCNGYPYYESFARDVDQDDLYDSVHNESYYKKEVQPITLESYVNIFTSIFMVGRGA